MGDVVPELRYPGVGGTRDGRVPAGFSRLSRTAPVGVGVEAFDRVGAALRTWDVHRGAGLSVAAGGPAAPGMSVRLSLPGPLDRLPLSITCQVVYVITEPGRRGFGYGTIPGQPEEGEARFLVDLHGDQPDAAVTFSVVAFSRPGTRWARALAPMLRVTQEAATQGYLRAARRAGR